MGGPNPNSLANLKLGRAMQKTPDWGKMIRTRHKLVDKCVRVMYQEFHEGGRKAIQRMRDEHPDKFILAIIGLTPKSLEISGTVNHAHLHAAITDPQVWLKAVTDSTEIPAIEQRAETIQQKIESGLHSLIKASDSENTESDDNSEPADDNI